DLYRLVLANLPGKPPPPPSLPAVNQPEWLLRLHAEERRFLDCCTTWLNLEDRIGVFLSFYAELGLRDIRCVQTAHRRWSEHQVVEHLRDAYRTVVRHFRQLPERNGA